MSYEMRNVLTPMMFTSIDYFKLFSLLANFDDMLIWKSDYGLKAFTKSYQYKRKNKTKLYS